MRLDFQFVSLYRRLVQLRGQAAATPPASLSSEAQIANLSSGYQPASPPFIAFLEGRKASSYTAAGEVTRLEELRADAADCLRKLLYGTFHLRWWNFPMTPASSRANKFRSVKSEHALRRSQEIDWSGIDALVLSTFEDKALLLGLRRLEKVELASVWSMTERALLRHWRAQRQGVAPLEVHQRLLEGLRGESLLVSSSMFLDTLQEVERFFDISFKTIKSKLGKTLDTSASELVMRAARVTTAAAELLGSFDAARRYMRTKNFALGGSTPIDLLKTAEGERLVLNELQAQADSGPL